MIPRYGVQKTLPSPRTPRRNATSTSQLVERCRTNLTSFHTNRQDVLEWPAVSIGSVRPDPLEEGGPPFRLARLRPGACDRNHPARPERVTAFFPLAGVGEVFAQPAAADLGVEHFVGPVVVLERGEQWIAARLRDDPFETLAGLARHQSLLDVP